MASIFVVLRTILSLFIFLLLASLFFHGFDMPREHGDCKLHDEWWWRMAIQDREIFWQSESECSMHEMPTLCSYPCPWRILESRCRDVPGQVLLLFMCYECHFWDTIMNFLFLINSSSNPHLHHHSMIYANHGEMRLEKLSDWCDVSYLDYFSSNI